MFGKAKKNVSAAYKEKLLVEIAHYEKRIEEALNKRKHFVSFENESFEEYVTNPYKFKITQSKNELKQEEASLSERVSMTLELGMLTIMQSEVNVMFTAPEVRQPVSEDGIWYEVAAECKIDLVSFTITFYAHKPHRKFAPTRYRNVAVTLVKQAHQLELEQSILPKLELPNLALQVLQSYATAFRSRRTTLRELAEKYEDKLNMEAMPSGGYRVRFLELLQVDWALENLWSPIVPFSHRMKFQLEYMPKDYIQAIRKLYKQFNNPLETSERTIILSKIFDICLQAAGPARDLQETFESDPETAGLLHERRTTIDQAPDVPNVDQSPKKKDPIGKENKPQNRKTSMAPPKTIPKKRKPNERDVIENRKSVKRAIESESSNYSKKSRTDDSGISKSKPGLKAGRVGINKNNETADAALKTKDTGKDAANNRETVAGFENNVQKSGKVSAKHTADTATKENDVMKKRDGKTTKPKESGDMEGGGVIATSDKDGVKKRDGKTIKSKESGHTEGDGDVNNAKKNKNVGCSETSDASSKGSKKDAKTDDKVTKSKDVNTENNATRTKKSADNTANMNNDKTTDKNNVKAKDINVESNVVTSKKVVENKANTQNEKSTDKNTVKSKDTEKENGIGSKKGAESTVNKKVAKKVATAKKDEDASSKAGSKRSEHGNIVHSNENNAVSEIAVPKIEATNKEDKKNATHTKDKLTKTKKVKDTDTVGRTSSKTIASKDDEGKIKAASNKLKDTNKADTVSKKVPDNSEKEVNLGGAVGNIREVKDKTKTDLKKPTQKDTNTQKQKQVVSSVINNKNVKEKNMKQTEKVVDKRNVAKENPTETGNKIADEGNNKEKHLAEKGKVTKPKSTEQTALDKNKMPVDKTKANLVRPHKSGQNEVLAKKRKTEADANNIKNNDNQTTTSTADKKQESKSNKPQNDTIILKENTNRETDNGKNSQNSKTIKNQKDMLNVTITKSKMIHISKLQTNKQAKTVDKLKSKIPMMKSKITFSSLGDKLKMNNLGTISKGEKNTQTKIPQKKLPVFKKVGNFSSRPTRISPRKRPTSKPSHGFSNHA